MGALIEVIAPVFLVVGFGYLAAWKGWFAEAATEGLMRFAQNFAVPCLLFAAISRLDLSATFEPKLLLSFYTGALTGFFAGLAGARLMFRRAWPDSVAVGFATLFSNSVLLGLPITERAYGTDALGPNFAIVAFHAPFAYTVGVTAMELVRAEGRSLAATLGSVARSMGRNPLVIALGLGFIVNLTGAPVPAVLSAAIDMVARAALPAALFGLGAMLVRYRPEGDLRIVGWICAVSLILHPAIVWMMGRATGLGPGPFRSAVLTASMPPGVNAYIFASMYAVAMRVAATAVLAATALSVITIWGWLWLLG